jgi:hypothetical protein
VLVTPYKETKEPVLHAENIYPCTIDLMHPIALLPGATQLLVHLGVF